MVEGTHEATATVKGNGGRALEAAMLVLTSVGFEIERKGTSSAELTGKRLRSSKQHPLLGASRVRLAAEGGRLRLTAELGGIARMKRFLQWFPTIAMAGAAVAMAVAFYAQYGLEKPEMWIAPAAVITFDLVFCLVFVPLITRHLEKQTREALDVLVANAAQLGTES